MGSSLHACVQNQGDVYPDLSEMTGEDTNRADVGVKDQIETIARGRRATFHRAQTWHCLVFDYQESAEDVPGRFPDP